MSEEFTYAEAGVNREVRMKSKAALLALEKTYKSSRYGKVVQLPYGNIFPVGDRYLDLVVEGVGTKVLLAQLANKYDTIGIDGVAMAVNDVIRSGATPLAIVDNIHAQVSNPHLLKEWMKGIVEAACEAGCLVPGGEIGDVSDVIKGIVEGKGFDMVFACVGEVFEKNIILGNNIEPRDSVIGLASSGIHSNGISLARRVLFKEWGGKYEPHDIPDGFNKEIVYEILKPTKIYVKPVLKAVEEGEIKGAVHITGDAYQKFNRLIKSSKGIGFEFENFKPQPIFELIQKTAREVRGVITDEEMLKTFNMGWGFAVVVDKTDEDNIIGSFEKSGVRAEQIGSVTTSRRIVALHNGKKLELS
jgi:phosphoribosylformylglycinamidine cyclo-ligase